MKTLSIHELDRVVKASADTNRIRILRMLQERKMCVCEMMFVLGISQPSVSRHLKKLKSAGFIESENNGVWTDYYLCPSNAYAVFFLKNLSTWMDTRSFEAQDKKKMNEADRGKLCCPGPP